MIHLANPYAPAISSFWKTTLIKNDFTHECDVLLILQDSFRANSCCYRVTRLFIALCRKGFNHDAICDAIDIVKVSTAIFYMIAPTLERFQ